jgi:hypothetical protein
MKQSSRVAAGVMCLMIAVLAAAEPAKKAVAVKPPWQRLLQGEDAKKAAEQEKQLLRLLEAGKFEDALMGNRSRVGSLGFQGVRERR